MPLDRDLNRAPVGTKVRPKRFDPKARPVHSDYQRQPGRRKPRNKARGDSGFYQDFRRQLRQENIAGHGQLGSRRPLVLTRLPRNGSRSSSGKPLPQVIPAAREFVRNSGAPSERTRGFKPCKTEGCRGATDVGLLCGPCFRAAKQQQEMHLCSECGQPTFKRFMRCRPCSKQAQARYKDLKAARA